MLDHGKTPAGYRLAPLLERRVALKVLALS